MTFKNKQQGFSLFVVLLVMLIIALLVIVTNQSSLTELRLSSNEADRKIALSRAEFGLREAEEKIQLDATRENHLVFDDACTNGLCQPVKDSFKKEATSELFAYDNASNTQIVAWHRCANNASNDCSNNDSTVLDDATHSIASKDGKASYIIEYLGASSGATGNSNFFRITAKAKGNNADTKVMLQSYIELHQE